MRARAKSGSRANVALVAQDMAAPAGPRLVEAAARSSLKLDLGCGQNPKEGFEGVDLYGDKAKHRVDLFKFPWPFASDSVDEIHCSHFLEHVPAREIEPRDLVEIPSFVPEGAKETVSFDVVLDGALDRHCVQGSRRFLGQDMLFAFMDECYRILKVDGWMQIIVPSGRSSRAFWDPTHRRFFMQETFLYFNADWRKQNGLHHYRVKAHFGLDVNHSLPQEETMRSPEAQATRFLHYWNVTVDWIAKLKKLPMPDPASPPGPIQSAGA
jgi:predicted SAM-dependent methyltransferase